MSDPLRNNLREAPAPRSSRAAVQDPGLSFRSSKCHCMRWTFHESDDELTHLCTFQQTFSLDVNTRHSTERSFTPVKTSLTPSQQTCSMQGRQVEAQVEYEGPVFNSVKGVGGRVPVICGSPVLCDERFARAVCSFKSQVVSSVEWEEDLFVHSTFMSPCSFRSFFLPILSGSDEPRFGDH